MSSRLHEDEEKQLLRSEFSKNSFNPEKWAEDRFENTTHQVLSVSFFCLRKTIYL